MRTDEGHGAQNRNERLLLVANPRAGGGRAGREREAIEAAAARAFEQAEVVWTEAAGQATAIVRERVRPGDIVAALGGDGTCNEVVNGLMGDEGPVEPTAIFTTIPYGTGGDLVRSLEIPRNLRDALWVAATGTTVHVDVGRVTWAGGARRWFINVAGAGANAEVCVRVNQSGKRWGGTATFLGAILSTVRDFEPLTTQWRWSGPDGPGEVELPTLAAFVANAHYCGAGLWVGRGGSMADGALDVTLVPPLTLGRAVWSLPHTRTGNFERIPGTIRFRADTIDMVGALPIETDGEPKAPGPAQFTLARRALQVRAAWRTPPISLSDL